MVGFVRLTQKIAVFKNLNKLKGQQKWDKVFVTDDLTDRQRNQVRDLRSLAAYGQSQGKNVVVRNQFIWVENRRYAYEEIHKLGPELTLEKAKTLVVLDGKGLAFQSKHSPLSNMYLCNIEYKNRKFLSSEATFHHSTAVVCNRPFEVSKIEEERDAYEAKRTGDSFRSTPEWDKVEDDEMEAILIEKFVQNAYCRKVLLESGEKTLLEATGDRKWTCGIPLARINTLTETYPGENKLGKKLMKVRGIIKGMVEDKKLT